MLVVHNRFSCIYKKYRNCGKLFRGWTRNPVAEGVEIFARGYRSPGHGTRTYLVTMSDCGFRIEMKSGLFSGIHTSLSVYRGNASWFLVLAFENYKFVMRKSHSFFL